MRVAGNPSRLNRRCVARFNSGNMDEDDNASLS